ncbi:MAG: hypothetical protein ACC618_00535 [Patescibacteria group bacterium]
MKSPKAPKLVTIAIFTTATLVLWVFFEVYRVFTTKTPPEVPEELLAPINPELDDAALKEVESRVFFEEADIPEVLIPLTSPQPTVVPQETTPTPQETGVEEATESAKTTEAEST